MRKTVGVFFGFSVTTKGQCNTEKKIGQRDASKIFNILLEKYRLQSFEENLPVGFARKIYGKARPLGESEP